MSNESFGFAASLKEYRKVHHLTQKEFAVFLNVSESTIKKWETEVWFPRLDEAVELSEKLGLTVDELALNMAPHNVSIHRETGLSPDSLETLRHRDDVISFYLKNIIEPLLKNNYIACDIIKMASIDRKHIETGDMIPDLDRYEKAGIKWSLMELFSNLLDDAVNDIISTDDESSLLYSLSHNAKELSVYKDFGAIMRSKDKEEKNEPQSDNSRS